MKLHKDALNYNYDGIIHIDRWSSVYYQLKETLSLKPESVLEIGPGPGVFKRELERAGGINYLSVDIAKEPKPDVIGNVTGLPFTDSSIDVVCAFQILEHLQWTSFEPAVKNLATICKRAVVISLPHYGANFKFLLKVPILNQLNFALKLPSNKAHNYDGEHYWEIGKKGYSLKTICNVFNRYFTIDKEFIPFENRYHHFFVLRKK